MSTFPRILIATGVSPPESGGPATYAKLLEERLPSLGFTVSVLPFRAVRHLPKIIRHAAYFWKCLRMARSADMVYALDTVSVGLPRSEEHTSELQSQFHLVFRLLLLKNYIFSFLCS